MQRNIENHIPDVQPAERSPNREEKKAKTKSKPSQNRPNLCRHGLGTLRDPNNQDLGRNMAARGRPHPGCGRTLSGASRAHLWLVGAHRLPNVGSVGL